MNRGIVLAILTTILFVSCRQQDTSMPDALNRRAYVFRYQNVDSSMHYADLAYEASTNYPDGRAEAISHRAFVKYQQMRYTEALKQLDSIDSLTNNQVELLCADVLRMKISQRTAHLLQGLA